MIEIELAEIEDRLPAYSPDAQADIRWLTRELRKAYDLGLRNPGPPASAIYDPLTGLLSGGAYGVAVLHGAGAGPQVPEDVRSDVHRSDILEERGRRRAQPGRSG